MPDGAALVREMNDFAPPRPGVAFWWLGQHSFALRTRTRALWLDPFLSDLPGRRHPPLVRPDEVTDADFVFGSHDHADHIDRPAWPVLAEASPEARFVVPELLRASLADELGVDAARFVGVDDGETVELAADLRVTGVAAAHEFLDRDPETGRCPYLGFVIETDGLRIYHSGDTCKYEGLETALLRLAPDLVFLPINGRDAERLRRNCIGNMTWQEAADLAGALTPTLAVPTHFDMFAGNTADPALFIDYMAVKHPTVETLVPSYGERVFVPAPEREGE